MGSFRKTFFLLAFILFLGACAGSADAISAPEAEVVAEETPDASEQEPFEVDNGQEVVDHGAVAGDAAIDENGNIIAEDVYDENTPPITADPNGTDTVTSAIDESDVVPEPVFQEPGPAPVRDRPSRPAETTPGAEAFCAFIEEQENAEPPQDIDPDSPEVFGYLAGLLTSLEEVSPDEIAPDVVYLADLFDAIGEVSLDIEDLDDPNAEEFALLEGLTDDLDDTLSRLENFESANCAG